MKEQIIFHIDVNNAFLSWTAVYLINNGLKIDIRTIPSIIGGDEKSRKGIVLAKSPIAKKYGIKTAETIYSAKQKCPNLVVYPPNYQLYKEKSQELMNYLKQFSPSQEQLSIDECFLDMSGMKYIYKDLIKLAYKIKEEVKEKFGYTVNIGIANNKLCAKMASDFEKPDKVHTLFKNEIVTKLWPLPVEELFMCGKKTTEELHRMKINTIGDLAHVSEKVLENHFKSQGIYLYNAARGIDNTTVSERKTKNQSISVSETLPYDYKNSDKLKNIIFRQTEEVCRELREKSLYTKTIGIIFKNGNFISYSFQKTLPTLTNNTKEILSGIYELFDENYNDEEIRLIGVRLSNLKNTKREQITLFDQENQYEKKIDNFQKTLDNINNKFGKSIIKPASLNLIGKHNYKNQK